MRTRSLRTLFLVLALTSISTHMVACKDAPTIPGTEVPDTEDNREILRVLEQYRMSLVQADAAGVLATAHPTYYDPSGTDDPVDDVDYEELAPMLRERLARLDSIRFTIDYLEVHVVDDRAVVKVWIDASFRLLPIIDAETGEVRIPSQHRRKQDHAMFEMLRDGSTWRITKGM